MKEEHINLRITKKLKQQLQEKAKAEKRTLSNYITLLLEEGVDSNE